MKINSNDELIEIIGEAFLWDIIDDYISTDVKNLKNAISILGYIELDDIEKITSAEVFDSDEFVINKFSEKNGVLTVEFEMPAIITAENDDKDVGFRITTACTGTVEIPDIDSYDWNSMDFGSMSRLKILSYSDLAKIIAVSYEYIEADYEFIY